MIVAVVGIVFDILVSMAVLVVVLFFMRVIVAPPLEAGACLGEDVNECCCEQHASSAINTTMS